MSSTDCLFRALFSSITIQFIPITRSSYCVNEGCRMMRCTRQIWNFRDSPEPSLMKHGLLASHPETLNLFKICSRQGAIAWCHGLMARVLVQGIDDRSLAIALTVSSVTGETLSVDYSSRMFLYSPHSFSDKPEVAQPESDVMY
jgi:hypothetical protein